MLQTNTWIDRHFCTDLIIHWIKADWNLWWGQRDEGQAHSEKRFTSSLTHSPPSRLPFARRPTVYVYAENPFSRINPKGNGICGKWKWKWENKHTSGKWKWKLENMCASETEQQNFWRGIALKGNNNTHFNYLKRENGYVLGRNQFHFQSWFAQYDLVWT